MVFSDLIMDIADLRAENQDQDLYVDDEENNSDSSNSDSREDEELNCYSLDQSILNEYTVTQRALYFRLKDMLEAHGFIQVTIDEDISKYFLFSDFMKILGDCGRFNDITYFSATSVKMKDFPDFSRLVNLKVIKFNNSELNSVDLRKIPLSCKKLVATNCNISDSSFSVNKDFINYTIEHLNLENNNINSYNFEHFMKLVYINVSRNRLSDISNIRYCNSIEIIICKRNNINNYDDFRFPKIRKVNFSQNRLTKVTLTKDYDAVILDNNYINRMICISRWIKKMSIRYNNLLNIPQISCSVNSYDLSNNNIKDIKEEWMPHYVKTLNLSKNFINEFPDRIWKLLDLEILNLKNNVIEEFDLNGYVKLLSVDLSHNKLKKLPILADNMPYKKLELNVLDNPIVSVKSSDKGIQNLFKLLSLQINISSLDVDIDVRCALEMVYIDNNANLNSDNEDVDYSPPEYTNDSSEWVDKQIRSQAKVSYNNDTYYDQEHKFGSSHSEWNDTVPYVYKPYTGNVHRDTPTYTKPYTSYYHSKNYYKFLNDPDIKINHIPMVGCIILD